MHGVGSFDILTLPTWQVNPANVFFSARLCNHKGKKIFTRVNRWENAKFQVFVSQKSSRRIRPGNYGTDATFRITFRQMKAHAIPLCSKISQLKLEAHHA